MRLLMTLSVIKVDLHPAFRAHERPVDQSSSRGHSTHGRRQSEPLGACAARAPDGKADLSGVWEPNANKYLRDIAIDLKAWRGSSLSRGPRRCSMSAPTDRIPRKTRTPTACPRAFRRSMRLPRPGRSSRTPRFIVIVYEAFNLWRQIFMDGRERCRTSTLPGWATQSGNGKAIRWWSIGKGLNGKAWLDQLGRPSTDALHVIERFRRTDFGHMDLQITIDDPKAYTKPWTVHQDAAFTCCPTRSCSNSSVTKTIATCSICRAIKVGQLYGTRSDRKFLPWGVWRTLPIWSPQMGSRP